MDPTSSGRLGTAHSPGKARRTVACDHCRSKKIRCNGSIPCSNCVDRNEKCTVSKRRRPRNHGSREPESTDLSRRVHHLEALLRTQTSGLKSESSKTTDDLSNSQSYDLPPSPSNFRPGSVRDNTADAYHDTYPEAFGNLNNNVEAEANRSRYNSSTARPLVFIHQNPGPILPPEIPLSSKLDSPQAVGQEDSILYVKDVRNLEYFGPRCFLSFCSRPAVEWVTAKVKLPGFSDIALEVIRDMSRMLKMSETLSNSRFPDPPEDVAWQYTRAYFDEAPEAAFGIVDRAWFESRLRAHLKGTKPDESAWYALRNALWASGCRIVLSKSTTFQEASRISWTLFENALSAHTSVLFLRTSMVGVQALVLMAYYSEGVGKMSLQYMLSSNAMRLACSKGLHRQPVRSWNIPPRDIKHRNWLFWSIYCLEKHGCSRSGRPSVMDDDEISCEIPEEASNDQIGSTTYCKLLIQLMQLSSIARKRLSSPAAMRKSPDQLIESVCNLNSRLEELNQSNQQVFCLDWSLGDLQSLNGLTKRQAQSLQSHYFSLILDINTPLTYPWSGIYQYAKHDKAKFVHVEAACIAVSCASRSAILATRHVHVDANCTFLIALYTPVYAFVNLFFHVLSDLNSTTTKSDLAVLDIALGYISNFEFTTEFEVSLSFIRKMCQYVRLAVEIQRGNPAEVCDVAGASEASPPGSDKQATNILDINEDLFPPTDYEILDRLPIEDFEDWSTLLSFTETGDLEI